MVKNKKNTIFGLGSRSHSKCNHYFCPKNITKINPQLSETDKPTCRDRW